MLCLSINCYFLCHIPRTTPVFPGNILIEFPIATNDNKIWTKLVTDRYLSVFIIRSQDPILNRYALPYTGTRILNAESSYFGIAKLYHVNLYQVFTDCEVLSFSSSFFLNTYYPPQTRKPLCLSSTGIKGSYRPLLHKTRDLLHFPNFSFCRILEINYVFLLEQGLEYCIFRCCKMSIKCGLGLVPRNTIISAVQILKNRNIIESFRFMFIIC